MKEPYTMNDQTAFRQRSIVFMAILLIGAVLRFYGLGTDLWLDEIASVVTYFRLPLPAIFSTYYSANQHLLYSAIGSLSIAAFGESAWAARLPAAIMGVIALPAFWWMARQVLSSAEALWAVALFSVSYHHIWFSQSARGYSGMVLCSILGTAILLRAERVGGLWSWCSYILTMTAGVGFLQNTAFVAGGHCIGSMLAPAEEGAPRLRRFPILLSTACVALLSLALHSLVINAMLRYFDKVDRTGLGWSDLPSFAPVVMTGLRAGLGLGGLLLLFTMLLCGWINLVRRRPLVAISAVAAALLNVAALIILKQGAYPRSFLYLLPFALLFATRGSFWIGALIARLLAANRYRPFVEAFPVALLVVASISTLPALYRYPKQDYRGALSYALRNRGQGEVVASVGLAAVAYRQQYAPSLTVVRSTAELSSWCREGAGAWVLYSFTRDMRLRNSAMYDFIQAQMQPRATFRGTLGDGNLYVAHCPGRV